MFTTTITIIESPTTITVIIIITNKHRCKPASKWTNQRVWVSECCYVYCMFMCSSSMVSMRASHWIHKTDLDVRHSTSCESGYLHMYGVLLLLLLNFFLPFSVLCIYMGTVCATAATAADVACVYVLCRVCVLQFHWRHSKIWRQNIRWYFHAHNTKYYSAYLLSFPLYFSFTHTRLGSCVIFHKAIHFFRLIFLLYRTCTRCFNFFFLSKLERRRRRKNCIAAHNKLINAHTQSDKQSNKHKVHWQDYTHTHAHAPAR